MKTRILFIIIFAFNISIYCQTYFPSLINKGFWQLDEVKKEIVESVEKHEGKQMYFIDAQEREIILERKYTTKDNKLHNFQAKLTWDQIPKILDPQKEYSINIYADVLKNINRGGSGIHAIIAFSHTKSCIGKKDYDNKYEHIYHDAINAEVYSGQDPNSKEIPHNSKTRKFFPAKYDDDTNHISYLINQEGVNINDIRYVIKIICCTGSSCATKCTYFYFYKWIGETPPITQNEVILTNSDKEKSYALKTSFSPNEIKPDGQSKAEIEAVLYEYTEGDPNSSKPLANKKVTFRIEQQYGISPGSLSTTEAYTDANGKVKIHFTAPSNDIIANKNILSSSIVARCDEYNVEDIAYLNFTFDRGEVNVEPNPKGVVSKYGIVPTDKRFPALIHAYFEDANGHKKPNSKVTFTVSGNKTYGILKVPGGQEGKSVTVTSDAGGNAEVLYYYNSDTPPDGPAMETIDIKSEEMGSTMKAYIYLGFDFSIVKAESGYEGKGIINAGEEIPIKIIIKDKRYPDLDISRVIDYWGLGGNSGNTRLNLKLEMIPKGEVPDYLLDKLKVQKTPQPSFIEEVNVKTFGDVKNLLYVKESSLYNHKGYPCVKPTISGQTNYEIKISLVDNEGKLVSGNTNSSYISLQTGQPADAFSIFLLDNPFGPNTDEAIIGRIILDLAGFGVFLNLVDGFEAINKGDYLFFVTMVAGKFTEKVVDLAKNVPGLTGELAEAYSVMTEGEKYGSLVFGPGVLTSITDAVVGKLASMMTFGTGKLILLHGEGSQSIINPKTGLPVAVAENSIEYDKEAKTISIKHGTTSVYFIPQDFEYKYENVIKSIEKPVTKGGKVTEKEKTKEKDKPKEKEKTKEKENKSNLFSGSWETTDFGTISFIITGSDVVATCTKNLAGMKGKLSSDGTKITGSWAKFPTYSSPNDAGLFSITVSADGKTFTGMWGKGTDSKAKLDKTLNGKKK